MPTSSEIVANKPLSGPELSEIMKRDFVDLLQQDGLLGGPVAFGRCSYEIRVIVHLDNFSYPTHSTAVFSAKRPKDQIAADPSLAAIESGTPLSAPSPSSYVVDTELHRDIDSPNVARIENGLPVTIQRRDGQGAVTEQSVEYPPEMAESRGPQPTITDRADSTRKEWDLPAVKVCKCEGEVKPGRDGCCKKCHGAIEFSVEK